MLTAVRTGKSAGPRSDNKIIKTTRKPGVPSEGKKEESRKDRTPSPPENDEEVNNHSSAVEGENEDARIDAMSSQPDTEGKDLDFNAERKVGVSSGRHASEAVKVSTPFENTNEVPLEKTGDYHPYSLILSSWTSKKGALKAMSRYKRDDLSIYPVKVDLDEKGEWWRIYAGYYRSRAEARKAKEIYDFPDSLVRKTPYAGLIGVFQSKDKMADSIQRLEKLGYFPYYIKGEGNTFRLFVGVFNTRKRAETQTEELQADGIQGQVVRR